jgi:uncharacterized protein (DUF1330 family)
MSVYLILLHEISDVEKYYAEYAPKAFEMITKHGGEVLVSSPDSKPLMGVPPNGSVVIKFPSEESAMSFMSDPDYQEAAALRMSITSNQSAVISPEVDLTGLA